MGHRFASATSDPVYTNAKGVDPCWLRLVDPRNEGTRDGPPGSFKAVNPESRGPLTRPVLRVEPPRASPEPSDSFISRAGPSADARPATLGAGARRLSSKTQPLRRPSERSALGPHGGVCGRRPKSAARRVLR